MEAGVPNPGSEERPPAEGGDEAAPGDSPDEGAERHPLDADQQLGDDPGTDGPGE